MLAEYYRVDQRAVFPLPFPCNLYHAEQLAPLYLDLGLAAVSLEGKENRPLKFSVSRDVGVTCPD